MCDTPPILRPPAAPRRPKTITQHGATRVDDYDWLRARDDPEVIAYLAAENAYTGHRMSHTSALQDQLYAEMKGRLRESDMSAPEWRAGAWHYTRVEAGKQYRIHCRKRGSLDAPEEVLLDENALAEGCAYFRVGVFKISPDQRWLAYSTDVDGDEVYTLRMKNLDTGELLPDALPNTYYGAEWAADNRTLFYTTLDSAKRPCRVCRHHLGAHPSQDALVHHEPDEAFFVAVGKTSSQAYLLIHLRSNRTAEIRYAPADQPCAGFAVLQPRMPGVEVQVDHHGDAAGQGQFLIVTNEQARDFKLMTAPAASPDRQHWRELVPHRPGVLLEHVHALRDYIVRVEREDGLQRIRMTLPDGSGERDVPFPELVYGVTLGANEDYDAASVRLHYSSLVTPNTAVDFDMAAGRWSVVKRDDIPNGYDPSQYECERLMAAAPDGARVPISLVRRKGAARDESGGLLLIGYGSYGASYDPAFDAKRLSLLDRGVAVAIAHVRGGSEMGRAWYEDGKLLRKTNTFTDFIACAEHLISLGHTSPARLAINGVSAGGLLMGAVTNLRPELFRAVVADVPFVDVINTMNDPSIPLTVIEYEEWGNPGDRAHFCYMMGYSPYDNVAPKAYPHLLVTAGLNDPRVQYWEPAKWVAKLRAMKTDDNVLLLRTNMGAGHGGASGRYDHLKEWAFRYAFILDRLGLAAETPYGHGGSIDGQAR